MGPKKTITVLYTCELGLCAALQVRSAGKIRGATTATVTVSIEKQNENCTRVRLVERDEEKGEKKEKEKKSVAIANITQLLDKCSAGDILRHSSFSSLPYTLPGSFSLSLWLDDHCTVPPWPPPLFCAGLLARGNPSWHPGCHSLFCSFALLLSCSLALALV